MVFGFLNQLNNIRYYNRRIRQVKNLIKTIIYGLGITLFFYRKRKFDIPRNKVTKVLFVSLYFKGDVLFQTPVLKLLKLIFVNARIDVWVKSRTKEILEGNKDVNEIIVFDGVKTEEKFDMSSFKYSAKLEFLRVNKQKKYDLIVDYTGLASTALFTFLMKPLYSIGKNEQGFGFLYNKFVDLDFSKSKGHLILKYMNLIKIALNISDEEWSILTKQVPPRGIIYLENDHISEIENILKMCGVDLSKHLICLHLTAGWSAKRWELANFAQLIKNLIVSNECEIVVVGDKFDEVVYEEVMSSIRKFVPNKDLSSRFFNLPVKLSAALIKRSSVFIGSDSFPLHVAGAVGTPSIGLFGPTNPEFSNPIGSLHHFLYHRLNCSAKKSEQYCSHNAGKTCKTIDCIKMILVDDILYKLKDIIQNDYLLN